MHTSTWSSIVLGLVLAAGVGCGPEDPQPIVDKLDSTLTFTCVDYGLDGTFDDRPFTGVGTTATVQRCSYHGVSQSLTVNLEGTGFIDVNIVGFTGVGTYATSDLETGTSIYMSAEGEAHGGTWASAPAGSFPAHACTIRVTDTNLPDVVDPAGTTTTGHLVYSLDCPAIGWGAVGAIECLMAPSTLSFAVANCEALND